MAATTDHKITSLPAWAQTKFAALQERANKQAILLAETRQQLRGARNDIEDGTIQPGDMLGVLTTLAARIANAEVGGDE